MIRDITCVGTPHEIGFKHGSAAAKEVAGSIAFYDWVFSNFSSLSWPEVRIEAAKFVEPVMVKYPRYYEEMLAIAEGAGVPFLDVMALNVRSEIAFGLFSEETGKPMENDGCTSLAWKTSGGSFISQNWDWMLRQKPNLIILRVFQPSLPSFQMITEAGIIGKIGFNSNGVGCCLNAIRARGVDPTRMPVHFGLRTVLESQSKEDAIRTIKASGIAASVYLLIGDASGAVGLECSSTTFQELQPDESNRICHANNFIAEHPGVYEPKWLDDSPLRTLRLKEIATKEVGEKAGFDTLLGLFKDEENLPTAINRRQEDTSESATLFNVVFDLAAKKGVVSMGRPTEIDEQVFLAFS